MNTGLEVAIVSAAASIVVAAASLLWNARQKRSEELRQLKLARYTDLLTAISDLTVHGLNADTQARYSSACNIVALTAPTSVIKAFMTTKMKSIYGTPREAWKDKPFYSVSLFWR